MPLDDTLNEEIDAEDAAAVWKLNYKEAAIYLEVKTLDTSNWIKSNPILKLVGRTQRKASLSS